MGWAAQSRAGRDNPVAGLRVLADLVDEALAALGMRPALGIEAAPQHPLAMAQSTIAPARATPATPKPRSAGAGTARKSGAAPPVEAPEPPGSGEVEEEHVESWRLVRLAQDGDGEAFGQLYDRYVDTVFRFVYFRVNDRALAEDFTSETFLRALRRIGTISYQGRDIGAWFVTIARNIILDHLKSARHRLETPTADTIEGRDHAESTEAAVLDTLRSERLLQAVKQLGAEQQECVLLRFVHGLSVSETAQVMGKNDGAIKALQHRAVRKLADIVGSELR